MSTDKENTAIEEAILPDTHDEEFDAAAIKAFLAEADAEKEEKEVPEKKVDRPTFKEVDLDENSKFDRTFRADPTFQKDEVEVDTKTYFAAVEDHQVPITDEDQALYMKAMLNDTEVHLTQSLMGGQLQVECRALSVYELDMVLLAAMRMSGSEGQVAPTALLAGCAQQCRVAMQVTRINDKATGHVTASPDRKDQDAAIDRLIEAVDAKLRTINSGKYGMLVRALNVFEHKLARMNALAYTGNFWKPVGTA